MISARIKVSEFGIHTIVFVTNNLFQRHTEQEQLKVRIFMNEQSAKDTSEDMIQITGIPLLDAKV